LTAIRAPIGLFLALLLGLGVRVAAAQTPSISITVGPASAEWRPFLRVSGLLAGDDALRDALASGLPLRFRFRIELWEKALLDRLIDSEEAVVAVLQDPLDRTYIVTNGRGNATFATLADTERAVARGAPSSVRPSARSGRFYYLATLDVETLSLTDLEELQRWLRGEVRPAVQGRAPVSRALGRGVQRALVRMVRLPTRRYATRSATFTVE
jgi:hypothetical protein